MRTFRIVQALVAWLSHRMPRLGLVVLLAGVGWSESEAGLNRWTKSGQGGYVSPLAASLVTPGLLWATDHDERLVRSTDGGATWKCVDVGEDAYWSGVYSLIADPADDETLYLAWDGGCCDEGFVKTSDGGRTWIDMGIYPPSGNYLAINPQNHDVLYAIGSWSANDLRKSTDGGRAWRLLMEFPSDCDPQAIAVDAIRPYNVYVGTECGIYKSSDAGQTWAAANQGLPGAGSGIDIRVLRAHPGRFDELWAATDRGIYHTTNGGADWLPLKAGLSSLDIRDVIVGRSDPPVLYAVASSGQLYRRHYSGTHWQTVSIPGAPASCRVDIQADPNHGNTLYATLNGRGVLRTTNSGRSWDLVGKHLSYAWIDQVVASPKHGGTAYVRNGTLLYKIIDGGPTWQLASGGLGDDYWQDLLVHPRFSHTVYVLGWNSVGRSIDGGKHWITSPSPPGCDLESGAIDAVNPRRVVAALDDGSLYETLDGGAHWTLLSSDLVDSGRVNCLLFDPRRSGVIYAGVGQDYDLQLWRSSDGGVSWRRFGPETGGDYAFSQIAADPVDGRVFYAIAGGRLLRWTTGDASWTLLFDRGESATGFAFDPKSPGALYLATYQHGVWRSRDRGLTWHSISQGLEDEDDSSYEYMSVSSIAVDISQPVLYAATEDGMYVRTIVD